MDTSTHGNLALKENQEPSFLVLVERPETTPCPSALREPRITMEQNGHVFDVLAYGNDYRVLQSMASAASYCLKVTTEVIGNQITTIGTINGRFVSRQDYLVYPRYAGMGRYIDRAEQAIEGAYDHLQMLVLSGKA